MSFLETIHESKDVKKLNGEQLKILSEEIRSEILSVVENNGGHLSSNLGIVELSVALHYVFDFPKDKLIFDVGHQCYAHKLLSGRKEQFSTIRQSGGISGFPDKDESEYDSVTSGHAGTSIASGIGLCNARDKLNEDYCVIDVVGDGSLVNGLNLEAIFSSESKPQNHIVILNDNGMSISKNKNGLYGYISKKTAGMGYVKSKNAIRKFFGNSFLTKFLVGVRNLVKRILRKKITFEEYGYKYVGVVDGNDLSDTIKILQKVKSLAKQKAVFLHVKTTKGKGLTKAEQQADVYHGVGKNMQTDLDGFGAQLSKSLSKQVDQDSRVVAIVSAMADGTGLKGFSEKYKDNFFDVGIAEEYAVTLASGMAIGGLKPVVCIYSTFMQRAYDQILHDVCMQNLPVVFCIDRAGLVGEDGKSHQGVFDLSYLSHMPNMTILCPTTEVELDDAISYALKLNSPVAIRYPRNYKNLSREFVPYEKSAWEVLSLGEDVTVLAVGPRMLELALQFKKQSSLSIGITSARMIKPLPLEFLDKIKSKTIFTLEENVLSGGFASAVKSYFNGSDKNVISFGVKDEFIKNGSLESQLLYNGLSIDNLMEKAKNV